MKTVLAFLLFFVSLQAAPGGRSYCTCEKRDHHKLWLDVVYVVDTSQAMGKDGVDFVYSIIESTLDKVNLPGKPQADNMYMRAAIVAYAKDVSLIANFSDVTHDSLKNIQLPLKGGNEVDIAGGIAMAMEIFHNNPLRNDTRKVIVLAASAFKDDGADLAANQFKNENGTIVMFNFVQPSQVQSEDLKRLASPGYFITNFNSQNASFFNFLGAFCDINCFCPPDRAPYSTLNNNPRKLADGGCYIATPSNADQDAAELACNRRNGTLASIHDKNKDFFLMSMWSPKTKFWIGYRRNGNSWTWDDGDTSAYTNWAPKNPKPDEDCAYSVQTIGFKNSWFSDDCDYGSHYYTCESRPCSPGYDCLV